MKTDNELIAEFMDMKLDYDTNWQSLMPVVRKIKEYHYETALSKEWFDKYIKPLNMALYDVDITKVHSCVIEFIIWHTNNENNNAS